MTVPIKKTTTAKPGRLIPTQVLTLAALFAVQVLGANAADIQWNDGAGSYNNAANWSPSSVPGSLDNAINDHGTGNAVQINEGDPDWTVGQIRAGNSAGNGAFVQNGQTVTVLGTNYNGSVVSEFFTPFRLGVVAADSGVYTLNGGTLNFGTGPLHVGEVGPGTLNINGGTVTGTGTFMVNAGGIAVPNPAVITATAGHGPYLGDYTYFEQGYSTAFPTKGLPPAGSTIVSVTQADHAYTLAPSYTANNAVILDAAVPSATITLTTPVACSALSFVGSAGNGPVTNNYTVHYASGAVDAGVLIIADWFGTGQEVLNVEGRVDGLGLNLQYPGTAGGNPVGNAPYLLSSDIALVNTDKVVSIDLTYVGGSGSKFATATILGVSGQDTSGNPFTPLAIGGYNADVVVEAGAPSPVVSSSVMDTVNQTGGTNAVPQLWVAQGPNAHATYNLHGGEINSTDWNVIGRSGGYGIMNMDGGTFTHTSGGQPAFIIGSGSGDNNVAGTVGILNQSAGTINCNSEYWLGENTLTVATNNISGTAVVNINSWLSIGRGGLGVVNQSGGTLHKNNNGNFIVGDGGNALFNLSGGAVTNDGELWVGNSGGGHFATINMSGGYLEANNWFQVGRGAATALLNFSGGTIHKTSGGGNFIIGDNNAGRVIQTGGTFTDDNQYWIGNNSGGQTCELDMTNGILNVGGEMWVGQGGSGVGVMNLAGGTVIVGSWLAIGRESAQGTLNLSGGSLTMGGGGNLSIAHNSGASGTVNQTGGAFTNVASETWIGENGAAGTWNMSGGTAAFGVVHLAQNADASGTVQLDGGVITASEVSMPSAGFSTFSFNGGTLAASASNTNFMHGLSLAYVEAGGAVIDSGVNAIAIEQPLIDGGGGGLTKNGTGALLLNGNNSYSGATTVTAGTLGGHGTLTGPLVVQSGAILSPGVAIGTLTVNNTVNLAVGSTTVMEVNKTANTSDLVASSAEVAYNGTLVLKNLSGTLQVGDTFTLFSAGSYSGAFSSVVSQTPNQTVTWDTSKLAVDGSVKVATTVAAPVVLASVVSGGNLHLSWPANQIGWELQTQSNPLTTGLSTNWVTVSGSTTTNQVSLPVDPTDASEFFRLVFPQQ